MISTLWTWVRLGLEPDFDLVPADLPIYRGELDGLPGSMVHYVDSENPESRYLQFHSDAQRGDVLATVPKLVAWFKAVEDFEAMAKGER